MSSVQIQPVNSYQQLFRKADFGYKTMNIPEDPDRRYIIGITVGVPGIVIGL